jgi:hypothetical protein
VQSLLPEGKRPSEDVGKLPYPVTETLLSGDRNSPIR